MNESNMKKNVFFVGLLSGLVLARTWKVVAKTGIKTGIRAGRKIKEISQQAVEDIQDLTAEATEELSEEDRAAGL